MGGTEVYRVIRELGTFCYRFRVQELRRGQWRTIESYSALFVTERWAERSATKMKRLCIQRWPHGGAFDALRATKVVG